MQKNFNITLEHRHHPADPMALCMDPQTTVLARVCHWATHSPNRTFLQEVEGARRTYSETHDELLRWCAALSERGIQRGDCVVSLLPQSIDACLVWLACAALGAIAVPINRELRGEFLRHVLRDAGPRLIFVRPEDAALLDAVTEIDAVPRIVLARGERFAETCAFAAALSLPAPDDVAIVIYTSGTTGQAKGALVTWAQIAAMITRIPMGALSASDVTYAPWPIFHVTGLSPLVTMAYFGGAVLFREKLSVSHFWDDVRRFRCTIATIAAAMPMLLAQPPREDDREHSLRFVFTIGGAMNIDFKRRFGGCLIGAYGSTEASFPLVNLDMDETTTNIAGWLRAGYEAKLCDGDGCEVESGKPGELWLRPPHPAMMFAGYLNRPDATAAAKVDGWYRTGDLLLRQPDGAFKFVDRIRDTIRRFGENISSTAMEYVVAAEKDVIECCVFGIPSPVCGQEVVLILRTQDTAFDPASFYQQLIPMLPKHMLPSYIATVVEFPKTPTNKILKNALAANFEKTQAWQSPAAIR
ncbi:MAG: AMP-binding protein [Spongiibacteraceae bacterium]